MGDPATFAAIEQIARTSYGRLVAYLAGRSRDIAGAEDALSEAFAAALRRWPTDGVPLKPEAWLLHAARNRLIDAARRAEVRHAATPLLALTHEAEDLAAAQTVFPDERLKLLFVCAHPAIDLAARTPLMLQTVLGLSAARIASAFLTSPAAMDQRLVRAKTKIRDAQIPFRVPELSEWEERSAFVLAAIYSAYNAGRDVLGDGITCHGLAHEALELGRTLTQLLPEEPEAHGLLALMLHCEARRPARVAKDGAFIPLDRQDSRLWVRPMIDEAEQHLRRASALKRPGRYQLEAAIHSIHADRARSGAIDWPQIALLYEGLTREAPTVGAQVGRAVALTESGAAAHGLAALDAVPADLRVNYQPWWAAHAHVLSRLGRAAEATLAFERAASLTDDPALRAYLLSRAARDPQAGC